MRRRSFLGLLGLPIVPKVVLARPGALRCSCTGGCSSEECGAGLPGLPPTCGAFISPELDDVFCRPCSIQEPDGGWGWENISLSARFDDQESEQRHYFHWTVEKDLWARKLTWSMVGDTQVNFFIEIGGNQLTRIPTMIQVAEELFDFVAPEGLLLWKGSQISGYFQGRGRGTAFLQLHCLA